MIALSKKFLIILLLVYSSFTYAGDDDGIDLVYIKGGCFMMGDIFGDGDADESPVHKVCIDDFYLSDTEVTQAQWQIVMGKNPSQFKECEECPVENVSWNEVDVFVRRLNEKTGLNYRLPTEAEWEYAAREGGKRLKWGGTNSISKLTEYAWFKVNSNEMTHSVGKKKPNGLGLYDMSGNVWEWVADYYDWGYYKLSPEDNPTGTQSGTLRVVRGGSWSSIAQSLRLSLRDGYSPHFKYINMGFRLARSIPKKE